MKQKLSRERENELCLLIELGGAEGKAATAALLEESDGIARKTAASFNSFHLTFEDFLQEARIGMLKAIQKHLEGEQRANGGRFTTIATIMAKAECNRLYERSAHSGFRNPQKEFWVTRKIYALREEGQSVEEIAESLEIDTAKVDKCLRTPIPPAMMSRETMSVGREDPVDALDENTDVEDEAMTRVDIKILLDSMPARLRQAAKLKYGIGIPEPLDDEEIARVFDVTVAQIRKILKGIEDVKQTQ